MDDYQFSVVGKTYPRHESFDKVTGRAQYTDDLIIPNMVYGIIIRSPYANAKVISIDKSEAEKVPGVLGILLPSDVPQTQYNCSGNPPSAIIIKDELILTDHPLYVGDRVAAIAAVSMEACKKAAKKLFIEYEPLKAVFEVKDAIAENAPCLHPEICEGNKFKKMEANEGDVEEGFRKSDFVFEEEFSTPFSSHVAMEPVGCICDYSKDGKLTIWSTSQTLFQERRILSEVLGLPESKIRMIKPTMGGGFGARQQLHNQPVGALLSKMVGRPVKIINTREEELLATAVRHSSIIRLKVGVTKDGLIKAFQATSYHNTGAYATHGPIVLAAQSRKVQYKIPNYKYEGYCVYTNSPVGGAFRGYGNPQMTFAREVLLDRIAHEIKMDPIEFRMKNHLCVGDKLIASTGYLNTCAIKECLEAGEKIKQDIDAKVALDNHDSHDDVVEAWGVAFCMHTSGPSSKEGMSSSVILVNDDGSVNLLLGSADIGQGCETTLSQIAAEELGIELSDITVTAADTLVTPYDTGAFGSSQMYVGGNAVCKAARDVKDTIKASLAKVFNIDVDSVEFRNGMFLIKQDKEEIELTFKEALSKITFGANGSVTIGKASFKAEDAPPVFAICWVKAAYDKLNKTIKLLDVIEAVDVGTAINPGIVTGQIEGGIHMGLGYALMEQIEINRRAQKPSTTDLLHYKILTSMDMPCTHTYIAKNSYEPSGPLGAKSVGELTTVPVAAAVANAVANATGEKIVDLPLSNAFILNQRSQKQHIKGKEIAYECK